MVCRLRPADRRRRSGALVRSLRPRDPVRGSGGRPPGNTTGCREADHKSANRQAHLAIRSGRVGATHPATALGGALVLVQATPGAVLLGTGNGVIEALDPDRAARADLLGLALPDVPLWLPLAVWAEEKHQILATTRGGVLPPPVRAGKHGRLPTHLRHGSITSTKLLYSCVTLASGLACTRVQYCAVTAVASCNAERPHTVPAWLR